MPNPPAPAAAPRIVSDSHPPAASALATVQALYAAFGRMDGPAFLSTLAPDVTWRFIGAPGLAYSASVQGHEGVQRWLGWVLDTEEILVFEPREFFAGGGHVTVIGRERTRARATDRVFECEWMHVFEVADGLVTRFCGLYDSARAAQGHAPRA